jgi:ABC-type enterochelin transport system permease subunit
MFADVEISEKLFEILRFIYIIIMIQHRIEETFAELARTDEKLVLVGFVFQHFDKSRFVYVSVIFGHDTAEIGIAVRQPFYIFFVHNL